MTDVILTHVENLPKTKTDGIHLTILLPIREQRISLRLTRIDYRMQST